jgi:hypothetical protein
MIGFPRFIAPRLTRHSSFFEVPAAERARGLRAEHASNAGRSSREA